MNASNYTNYFFSNTQHKTTEIGNLKDYQYPSAHPPLIPGLYFRQPVQNMYQMTYSTFVPRTFQQHVFYPRMMSDYGRTYTETTFNTTGTE